MFELIQNIKISKPVTKDHPSFKTAPLWFGGGGVQNQGFYCTYMNLQTNVAYYIQVSPPKMIQFALKKTCQIHAPKISRDIS